MITFREFLLQEKELSSDYTLHNDMRDAYRGDVYGSIRAAHIPSEKYVGHIDYSAGHQDVAIHHIETDNEHQGKGVGRAMMDHLKKEFPHRKIRWGMTTPEGEKFKRAYYKKPKV